MVKAAALWVMLVKAMAKKVLVYQASRCIRHLVHQASGPPPVFPASARKE